MISIMVDWDSVLEQLRSFPANAHKIRAACPIGRIVEEGKRLGTLPTDLSEMLRRFNGGELFTDAMPMITLFGLSLPSDSPGFDWFIDRYTPVWRAKMGGPQDWVIGMTNYGGIAVLGQDLLIREWDSAERKWSGDQCSFRDWIRRVLIEGAEYLREK
jgi:hypothetical protein